MSRAELIAAVLLAGGPALLWAHKPLSADVEPGTYSVALEIEEPRVSQVYYARLDPDGLQVWLTFQAEAGQTVELSLGVPVIERLRDLRPRLALVGPGLEPLVLPFPAPQRSGRGFVPGPGKPRFFHEPITGTDSWILLEVAAALPRAGRYYAVAYLEGPVPEDPKLWIAIGRQERFGLADFFRLAEWTRMVREFHEVGPRLRPRSRDRGPER